MVTAFGAGEPFVDSLSFSHAMTPAALACRPFELTDPSKFAKPPMPAAGSTNPDEARSMSFTLIVASKGVLAESCGLMGPAFPETLAPPPPGRLIVNLNGNCEVEEKFFNSILNLSYTCGLAVEFVFPTTSFPSLISTLAMDSP